VFLYNEREKYIDDDDDDDDDGLKRISLFCSFVLSEVGISRDNKKKGTTSNVIS